MTERARRERDAVEIPGDYQARALVSDRAAQRFWHAAKLRIVDRLAPARPASRIADVGCGSGVVSHHLAATAMTVVGIDSNPSAIDYARAAYRQPNLRFELGQFERLRELGPFDQVYCLEVLEHLFEPQARQVLGLLREVTRPGGSLFVTTPNYRSLWPAIEMALDRFGLVPRLAGDQHVSRFTKSRLAVASERAGWHVVEMGTFNGVAPFLAPVAESLAATLEAMEFRWRRQLPLNLLYCLGEAR